MHSRQLAAWISVYRVVKMVLVKNGDVVYVDFVARLARDKTAFSTSIKEEAERAGLRTDFGFKPLMIIVGKGQVVRGLDEAIAGSEVGQAKHVFVPVEKAYGPREAAKVRLVSMAEFRRHDIDPRSGMPVEFEGGQSGVVRGVEGGRVRVDFNDPLAGEDLEYDFTVTKCAADTQSKLSLLLDGIVGLPPDSISIDFVEGVARVKVSAAVRKNSEYMVNKVAFVSMALAHVDGLKKVVFEEEYAASAPEPAANAPA